MDPPPVEYTERRISMGRMEENNDGQIRHNANYNAGAKGSSKFFHSFISFFNRYKASQEDNDMQQISEQKFKANAKIWGLYLKDADEAANERVESWKTRLDSLLIFTGLFAGVVSSFVTTINSSGDSQQSGTPPSPSAGDLWIKGLWATSLLVTLFSAVMGVLAKAWIVKFIPVITRREATDAVHRRNLDRMAKRWRLEQVIKVIPLLIQIAAFLFGAGFVVQSFADNRRIGVLTVVLAGVGLVVYLVATVLPLLFSSPFDTPLSDLYLLIKEFSQTFSENKEENGAFAYSKDEAELADIWINELIKSPKTRHVQEAIAELTRQWSSLPDWHEYFAKSEAPTIIVKRLQECITFGFYKKSEEYEGIFYHFESLLQFTHFHESLKDNSHLSTLRKALADTLQPNGSLHHWNLFPEEVTPLAFILRTHLVILAKSGHLGNSLRLNSALIDLAPNEVEDRPWENMVHAVQPRHRLKLLIAACRGLIQGERNIHTVSLFILSLSIAKAAAAGSVVEWSGEADKSTAEDLGRKYLTKLFQMTTEEWDSMITIESSSLMPNPNVHQTFRNESNVSKANKMLDNIISLLSHSDNATRIHAVKYIKEFSRSSPAPSLNHLIPKLAEVLFTDEDDNVREEALDLFMRLQGTEKEICEIMTKHTSTAVKNGLQSSGKMQLRTLQALTTMKERFYPRESFHTSQPEIPGLFETFIDSSITELAKLAIEHDNKELDNSLVQYNGRKLLCDLLLYEQYRNEVEETVRNILAPMLDEPWLEWSACLKIFNELLELLRTFTPFQDDMKLWINIFIIDRIFGNMWFSFASIISSLAEKWLADLLDMGFIRHENHEVPLNSYENYTGVLKELQNQMSDAEWKDSINQVFDQRLKSEIISEIPQRRYAAVRFCQQPSIIPELIRTGVDSDLDVAPDIRSESLGVLKFLVNNYGFTIQDSIKTYLQEHFDRIFKHESPSFIQIKWIEIVALLANQIEFHSGVRRLMEIAVNSNDVELRLEARSFLSTVSSAEQFPEKMIMQSRGFQSLEDLIHHFCDSPISDKDLYWLELLVTLKKHSAAKHIISKLTPLAIKMNHNYHQLYCETPALNDAYKDELKDSKQMSELKLWVQACKSLAECYDQDEQLNVVPILLDCLHRNKPEDVRSTAMSSLACLALIDKYRSSIIEIVRSKPELLTEREEYVHLAWINTFEKLSVSEDESLFFLQKLQEIATNKNNKYGILVCAEAVSSLTRLASNKATLLETIKSFVSDSSIKSASHWQVRMEWVELCILMTKNKSQNFLSIITYFASKDKNEYVRNTAMRALILLVKDEDKLNEVLLESCLSIKDSTQLVDSDWSVRLEWIELYTILTQKKYKDLLLTIIKIANDDENEDVRLKAVTSLKTLVEGDQKICESFVKVISAKHLESGLSDAFWLVCLGWLDVMESLPQSDTVQNAMTTLVDIIVSHNYEEVQKRAMDLILKLADRDKTKFSPSVALTLKQKIESALKGQDKLARIRAINAVRLIPKIKNAKLDQFIRKDILNTVGPYLLKIAMTEEGEQQSEAERVFEDIEILRSVLAEIHSSLSNITEKGKDFVTHSIQTGVDGSDTRTASSVARKLAPVLKSGPYLARCTAIKALAHLYEISKTSFPQLIYDTVSDVISFALEEQKVDNEVRFNALDLLTFVSDDKKCSDEIKRNLPNFLLLLEHDELQVPVVRLISSLAKDVVVRTEILSEMISLSAKKDTRSFKGYITLLARLLMDERLKVEPTAATDYVVILLTCSLVTHPRLDKLRFRVLSALRCYYTKKESDIKDNIPVELVQWFMFALFGRHATKEEVDVWCEMGAKWLSPDASNQPSTVRNGMAPLQEE
ncbi:armadillo-type protein [Cyathus striatus]|nr:armadillo-type protein [Cyathus striatus]